MGIQFGFGLQNANVSRIFETLGASIDQIPILWIAAPLTGLLVQPIIGYFSDRTWTGLGAAVLTFCLVRFHHRSLWLLCLILRIYGWLRGCCGSWMHR